ncbi:hypothetical protein AJ78_03942 [Emergomyces pasteurianus Ep9510]|uniref:Uncharacterized protein n=1 Tax=Emergomyces pasteurianus Ep9510 TaxID=1447872 RepID=A0A1J9QKW7_9EURO|nr:hypothetical protein AJ78_03942 [Emergomyces pasteurianus Ep9510]
MAVFSSLRQLLPAIKKPLVRTVRGFDSAFNNTLPAPQQYTFTNWTMVERGFPNPAIWGESYYDKKSRHYCKYDFSVYNVTFADVTIFLLSSLLPHIRFAFCYPHTGDPVKASLGVSLIASVFTMSLSQIVWIKIPRLSVIVAILRQCYSCWHCASLEMIMMFGDSPDQYYMREAAHCIDRGFYSSETFQKTKALDSCWPSYYFRATDAELFAEIGVLCFYDHSGKSFRQRGFDSSCLSNGLKAIGDYAGDDFKETSKCFKREENSPIFHPTDTEHLNPEPYISTAVIEDFSNPQFS